MIMWLFFLLFISIVRSCPLKTVDSHSGCYCGIEIDSTNYIHCRPHSISIVPEFTRSYIHDKLNLSNNNIRYVTNQSFDQLKVKRIFLQQNPIETIDIRAFDSNVGNYLEELYLDANKNVSIDFFCYGTWRKLRMLELSGFDLYQSQSCLGKLHRLERLIIRRSHIEIISHYIYALPFLHELSLIDNDLENLRFNDDNEQPLLSSIRILNLTRNRLSSIPDDLVSRMPHLTTLDLSYNAFEMLPIISRTTTLNINLSHNRIQYSKLTNENDQHFYDLSSNPICTIENFPIRSNFILNRSTYLHCDCRLAFFLYQNLPKTEQLNDILQKKIDGDQPFGNQTICAMPRLRQGQLLQDVTYGQLLETCSTDLPDKCIEVTNFEEIRQFATSFAAAQSTTETSVFAKMLQRVMNNNTQELTNNDEADVNSAPETVSFRLTSFYTIYQNNNLLIFWDYDTVPSSDSITNRPVTEFEVVIEQELGSRPSSTPMQIIRRSGSISPHLKQYIIHHVPPNTHYFVCLLLTRSHHGTDKYCRETRSTVISTTIRPTITSKQAILLMLFTNRSIVFGFLVGTILTAAFLLTLAFLCHLRRKRRRCRRPTSSLFHHRHHPQQHYMYVDRNEDDGTYSNSIFTSSSKYEHFRKNRRRTCFPSLPPNPHWYRRGAGAQHVPPPPPPCCFLHHLHTQQQTSDTTLSSSTTTRQMATLSSQYSTGMDKEATMSTYNNNTSSSFMSSTSSDEQQNHHNPAKHVYEELGEETGVLRRSNPGNLLI